MCFQVAPRCTGADVHRAVVDARHEEGGRYMKHEIAQADTREGVGIARSLNVCTPLSGCTSRSAIGGPVVDTMTDSKRQASGGEPRGKCGLWKGEEP